jgi:hypothetical protein
MRRRRRRISGMFIPRRIAFVAAMTTSALWFWIGWQLGCGRRASADEALTGARQALLRKDWDLARDLALDVERRGSMASELRREAEHRREERAQATEFVAAAAHGDVSGALAAYEKLEDQSAYRAQYATRYAELRRRLVEIQGQTAERLLADHDCGGLKRRVEERNAVDPTVRPVVEMLLARCYRERTIEDLLRVAETAVDDVSAGEELQLLGVQGAARPRALRLVGNVECARHGDLANKIWRSLGGADRRAFAAGCAVYGETLPLATTRGASDDGDP